jgi:hypothetical protein
VSHNETFLQKNLNALENVSIGVLSFFEGNSVVKKYILFVSFTAIAASVSLARLNTTFNPANDPNLRAGGASSTSFADQVASFVVIAAALNSGGASSTSLSPATSEVSDDNAHIQLSGSSKPAGADDAANDSNNTEI